MTNEELDAIDEFIATKVMNYNKFSVKRDAYEDMAWNDGTCFVIWCSDYRPTRNIEQAIEAVDGFCDSLSPAGWVVRRMKWTINKGDGAYVTVIRWGSDKETSGQSLSPYLAISLALKAAVEAIE